MARGSDQRLQTRCTGEGVPGRRAVGRRRGAAGSREDAGVLRTAGILRDPGDRGGATATGRSDRSYLLGLSGLDRSPAGALAPPSGRSPPAVLFSPRTVLYCRAAAAAPDSGEFSRQAES